jgi:hypothetical protein
MKILLLSPLNNRHHTDGLEMTITYGLRAILGTNFIEHPRKNILYHDFSTTPRHSLKGAGFTYLRDKLQDIPSIYRESLRNQSFDAVIIGTGPNYGESIDNYNLKDYKTRSIWHLDGHDLFGNAPRKIIWRGMSVIGTQYSNCFKRELVEDGLEQSNVYPTGFGVPGSVILPINLEAKDQLFQQTAPAYSLFKSASECSAELGGSSTHHIFCDEDAYYHDMARSWFGLSCIKGGWDCLRHYEIIAAGTVLLFRDFALKPKNCSPQDLPCPSYSSPEELVNLVNKLLPNGTPTAEYLNLLAAQRRWLIDHGTYIARAKQIIGHIADNLVLT